MSRRGPLPPVLLLALVLNTSAGCATVQEIIGVFGGRTLRATLTTDDGAKIILWRWSPTRGDATRVLVLPEIGFDHRLVTPFCERLRNAGYDVATLDGREVTGARGRFDGYDGWAVDVARAAVAHGPGPVIVGIGVAGSAGLTVLRLGAARGMIAINVPIHHEVANDALRLSLRADGYDPQAWLERGMGPLLLGAGRATKSSVIDRLQILVLPVSQAMNRQVTVRLADARTDEIPAVPIRALVSVKDNLVASEDALPDAGRAFTRVRRLGLLEGFQADYGHLDWLVDKAPLEEVASVVAQEIEQIP
jgi:hypothetical protein